MEKLKSNLEKIKEKKKEWLNFYKENNKYKNVNMQVLEFIAEITFFPNLDCTSDGCIDHLFLNGYCYYFAQILNTAFSGGTICWSVNRGHIVWLDGSDLQNDIAYDITGVYEDYEELRPVSYLGTTLIDFLHNCEKWKSNDEEFEKYCKEKNAEEIYEIETIWMQIPKEELMKYDRTNLTLPEVALDYWRKKL